MKYLIPYDFTPITRSALDHALVISKAEPGEIELLHIISNEDERQSAEDRFQELLQQLNGEARGMIATKIRQGSIFTDISKEAAEGNVQLLIMGTHGAKGLQKVLGSHAIKVITSSKTPFIVTQAKGPSKAIERIVIPVDLTRESLQVVRFARDLAKKFSAEVHLVYKPVKDEFLVKKLRNNINKAKTLLNKEEVKSQVFALEGKKSLHKEVVEYGAKHRADLFAIAHYPESLIPQFDKFSQELITNKLEIPVLIVNAQEVAGVRSNYSFIGI